MAVADVWIWCVVPSVSAALAEEPQARSQHPRCTKRAVHRENAVLGLHSAAVKLEPVAMDPPANLAHGQDSEALWTEMGSIRRPTGSLC